jgi:hypothetical protein
MLVPIVMFAHLDYLAMNHFENRTSPDNANSNMAKLLNVEKAVADNNLSLATTQNAQVMPNNSMEESYKLLYAALLNYQNGAFTSADSLTITEIAMGCPTLQGSAVSHAATLYNVVYQTAEVFDNYCPEWVDKNMQISTENELNNVAAITYSIYPIPNNGEFKLRGMIEKGYTVEITSMDGKSVYQQVFISESTEETIKTTLQSGSYTVILTNTDGISLYKEKIVILN